jgi:membrane complex biogenesis BtpA family protein
MDRLTDFSSKRPLICAALHLPPTPGSHHPDTQPLEALIEHALRNARRAVLAGVPALYFQDLGDYPWAPAVQTHTIATMSVVGAALRREFPDLFLGVACMAHGAEAPLAIAQAIGAQFVRLKVYVGAMVKSEGLLEGCAYEAVTYRAQIQAENIAILADVYDRTGQPLGPLPLPEAARFAATFGRADGLILTGHSFSESLQMLEEVRGADVGVPLILGGGVKTANVGEALAHAEGVIVSTSFKPTGVWTETGIAEEWDEGQITGFMEAVNQAAH